MSTNLTYNGSKFVWNDIVLNGATWRIVKKKKKSLLGINIKNLSYKYGKNQKIECYKKDLNVHIIVKITPSKIQSNTNTP